MTGAKRGVIWAFGVVGAWACGSGDEASEVADRVAAEVASVEAPGSGGATTDSVVVEPVAADDDVVPALMSSGVPGDCLTEDWQPSGFFPGVGDEYLRILAELTKQECCTTSVQLGLDLDECIASTYWSIVPRLQWVACATRMAQDSEEVAEYFALFNAGLIPASACVAAEECRRQPCDDNVQAPVLPDVLIAECPDQQHELCPDGTGFARASRCNGVDDCADGFDETNCTPSDVGFECGDGQLVPWPVLCDGVADCATEVDESSCYPLESAE